MNEETQKQSGIREAFDIVFVFVLAFVCLVVPTQIQGSVLVGWTETGAIQFVWDPVGYFSLLAGIIAFFAIMLYHSVSHYKF
ncbi:AcrB/AcrD/AcrF family protein [uncultured Methanolobus sp.]|uniref:AcrB/AcrD/AcrF family protein n=1 Tax=uncultured Methanolobus sp. TaxID=218300 RepID=UPI0029C82830|nr:AcrB/AcrD/AcrF family protein [uncultured Methanolobus sp.]